jgi:hypothetical protein
MVLVPPPSPFLPPLKDRHHTRTSRDPWHLRTREKVLFLLTFLKCLVLRCHGLSREVLVWCLSLSGAKKGGKHNYGTGMRDEKRKWIFFAQLFKTLFLDPGCKKIFELNSKSMLQVDDDSKSLFKSSIMRKNVMFIFKNKSCSIQEV